MRIKTELAKLKSIDIDFFYYSLYYTEVSFLEFPFEL